MDAAAAVQQTHAEPTGERQRRGVATAAIHRLPAVSTGRPNRRRTARAAWRARVVKYRYVGRAGRPAAVRGTDRQARPRSHPVAGLDAGRERRPQRDDVEADRRDAARLRARQPANLRGFRCAAEAAARQPRHDREAPGQLRDMGRGRRDGEAAASGRGAVAARPGLGQLPNQCHRRRPAGRRDEQRARPLDRLDRTARGGAAQRGAADAALEPASLALGNWGRCCSARQMEGFGRSIRRAASG